MQKLCLIAHLDSAQRPFSPAVCHGTGTPCGTVLAGLATQECHTQPGERAWLSQQGLHPAGATGCFRVRETSFRRQGWIFQWRSVSLSGHTLPRLPQPQRPTLQ